MRRRGRAGSEHHVLGITTEPEPLVTTWSWAAPAGGCPCGIGGCSG